ncbi:hypothetical protein [Lelliottia amnigena]|uniref:hypothetical protein n=1 Tax=Lelliottia amnigena TaxID=61646 RepID=UPI00293BF305|nr:hypothetical protein [Lelliottia amnigena]
MTTTNKPMTGEQLDELMTVAVNMQRDSEKAGDRPAAMFAYAVQVAVLEIRDVRSQLAKVGAENAGLKNFIASDCHIAHVEPETFYEVEATRYVSADGNEPETPATDAFLAEVRASGVDAAIEHLLKKFEGTGSIGVPVMALESLAHQLRQGGTAW